LEGSHQKIRFRLSYTLLSEPPLAAYLKGLFLFRKMSLLDAIKSDAKRILSNSNEFAQLMMFTAASGETAQVKGIHTKHHLGFDIERAQETNTLKAHVVVSEQDLLALEFPVRDDNGYVRMKGDKVTAADANGTDWTYVITEVFPNDKLGTISMILGKYVAGSRNAPANNSTKIFDKTHDSTFE
jgi:hypothetical protein